jgi:hypothetical protein
MGADRRGGKPKSRGGAKGITIDVHTDLADTWRHFLPVPLGRILTVARTRARQPVHKEKGSFTKKGLKAHFCVLFGACQFKPGTGPGGFTQLAVNLQLRIFITGKIF